MLIKNDKMDMSSIIRKITIALLLAFMAVAAQAQIVITGSVKNEKGFNLVGAYITVDGTNIRTLSDLDGKFILSIPENYANSTVTINYVGYIPETLFATDGDFEIVLHDRESQEIDEMRVTTQKRDQRLVEVPIAVSLIDSAKIRQTSLYNIDEMSYFVPGFHATVPDGQVVFYSIRGVSSEEPESYGQSRISVFMDNISISRIQHANIEQYDMQQVEVVKGPQGTLFGRGAELGAVHFHRNKPTKQFGVDLSMLYGNYNQRKVVGVVNTPAGSVVDNRFAFCYNAHDGFIKNRAGGRLNGQNTIAVRNSTLFHLGDKNELNLVFDYQKDDNPGYSYQSKTQFNDHGEITTTDKSPFTTANLNMGKDLGMKREFGGVLANLQCQLGEHLDFTSITGVRAFKTKENFDIDGTMLRIVDGRETTQGFQASEELRFNWTTTGKKLSGFFGASYFYERNQHNYEFSGNLHYIFPLAVGKNLRTSLSDLPEQIIGGVEQIITQWAIYQKENTFKKYENEERDGVKVGEIMDQVITVFAATVTERIRAQVSSQFSNWFDVIYWDRTPDFFNDTKKIITSNLRDAINQLLEDDTYKVRDIFDELHMNGESIVASIDVDSGLTMLQPYSNVELGDNHYENEIDYSRTNEASAFADFTWNFLPKLYLTLGIRGTYETAKTGYSSESWTAPLLGYILYHSTEGKTVWTDKNYKSWVGRAVLHCMLNKTHNVYLSASKGRRPGMIYFNYKADDIVKLNPEITYSYELGIKGNSKYGHLAYTIATYYYDWKNFQTSVAARGASESGALQYISADNGKAYGSGVELTGIYTFNPKVSIFADFAYNGGTFSDKDMNGQKQLTAGNQFPMMPQYTYTMGLNWKRELSGSKVIYFYPSFYAQSKMYFDFVNNPDFTQDPFVLLNANAGIQWTSASGKVAYDLGIYGHNITNTKHIVDAGNAGEVIGLPTYEIAAPATYYLSFRIHVN